ncbi:hypothetical protein M8C21_020457 [Ambrosia artemisiifolia]|uniref:Uncharacterized protein n=1 Tax=Ambrosia artemisiifolia TaxID=4212 RepID=A0AAD5BVK5_AMBAR|nr:hypothetical protein M8C21_020457 [Ambrosia artemisiifolia]
MEEFKGEGFTKPTKDLWLTTDGDPAKTWTTGVMLEGNTDGGVGWFMTAGKLSSVHQSISTALLTLIYLQLKTHRAGHLNGPNPRPTPTWLSPLKNLMLYGERWTNGCGGTMWWLWSTLFGDGGGGCGDDEDGGWW